MLGTTKPPYTLALHRRAAPAGRHGRPADRRDGRAALDRRGHQRGSMRTASSPTLILFPSTTPTLDARRAAIGQLKAALRRADVLLRPARLDGAAAVDGARSRRSTACSSASPRTAVAAAGQPRARLSRLGEVPQPHLARTRRPRSSRTARTAATAASSTMPYPAWDLVPLRPYYASRSSTSPTSSSRRAAAARTPATSASRRSTRGTSSASAAPKDLVDEIERTYREHGIEFFYLWGDTVTLNVKSFTAFCDELIARKLPIQWFGNARADNLTDPAFVHRLKRAGCWMLALGIETESEEVRKDMVKRLERQKIEAAFRNMRDAGDQVVRVLHLRLSRARRSRRWTRRCATRSSWIRTSPTSTRRSPIRAPRSTRRSCKDGLLPAGRGRRLVEDGVPVLPDERQRADERVVMDAINRAKRRFFLRPGYLARHVGDVARLARSKQAIFAQVLSRTLFGAQGRRHRAASRPQGRASGSR